jgi:hypothetical protein
MNDLLNENADCLVVEDRKTFAQQAILDMVKKKNGFSNILNWWTEYDEYYDSDYNDCHGDYYDSN